VIPDNLFFIYKVLVLFHIFRIFFLVRVIIWPLLFLLSLIELPILIVLLVVMFRMKIWILLERMWPCYLLIRFIEDKWMPLRFWSSQRCVVIVNTVNSSLIGTWIGIWLYEWWWPTIIIIPILLRFLYQRLSVCPRIGIIITIHNYVLVY